MTLPPHIPSAPVQHVQSAIDWAEERRRWDAEHERRDSWDAAFIESLIHRGATLDEIAEHIGVSRPHVSRLVDYGATLKLVPVGTTEEPSERELRPFISEAASEVASERGVERVRGDRQEVHERAAQKYEESKRKPHVAHNSGNNEWYTPKEYIDAAVEVMGGIDLDPASSEFANDVVGASRIFTVDDNGLSQHWAGRIWMNPPYATPLIGQFAEKLAEHVRAGDVETAIVLVNNATETEWFQTLAGVASAAVFPRRRVKFWSPVRDTASPLQGQAVLYIGSHVADFMRAFGQFGAYAVFKRMISDAA